MYPPKPEVFSLSGRRARWNILAKHYEGLALVLGGWAVPSRHLGVPSRLAQQPQLRAAIGGRAVVGDLQLAPARPVLRQEEIVREV